MTLGYTLATKVVAYEDRGRSDPWSSKDLEDLVSLFDAGAGLLSGFGSANNKAQHLSVLGFVRFLRL